MKVCVITENGDLVHTLRKLEQYDLTKNFAQSDVVNFLIEAQKTAKFFAFKKQGEMLFTEDEMKYLDKRKFE